MSPPPLPLHSTMGAMYIGVLVAALLYGISIVQAYYYYKHQSDKSYLILLVTVVMVCDTVHQSLITHTAYNYVISYWGIVDELGKLVWSLAVQNLFNALTAFLVQGFLTARVWRLSNGNILLTTLLALFVLAEFASVVAFTILLLQFDTFGQLLTLKPLSLAVNILTAVGDLLIALSLCTLLHLSRTGFRRSDTMINKLILFSVNTGLLTSFCALASFIAYMAAPNTFIYITFYFCIGRLYTNSLLATLNAREMVRNAGSGNSKNSDTLITLPLSNMSKKRTSSKRHGAADIEIRVNTTKEYATDLTYDQEQNDKIEYLQTTSVNAAGFEGEPKGV